MTADQLRADGWVKDGHVWRHPSATKAAASGSDDEALDDLMVTLAINLAAAPVLPRSVTAQRICPNCGCLLLPAEDCPACRFASREHTDRRETTLWCERAAVAHSWRPVPYVPNDLEEVAAA